MLFQQIKVIHPSLELKRLGKNAEEPLEKKGRKKNIKVFDISFSKSCFMVEGYISGFDLPRYIKVGIYSISENSTQTKLSTIRSEIFVCPKPVFLPYYREQNNYYPLLIPMRNHTGEIIDGSREFFRGLKGKNLRIKVELPHSWIGECTLNILTSEVSFLNRENPTW